MVTCPLAATDVSFKSRTEQVKTFQLHDYPFINDVYYVIIPEEIEPSDVEVSTATQGRFGTLDARDINLELVKEKLNFSNHDTIWAYRCDRNNKL